MGCASVPKEQQGSVEGDKMEGFRFTAIIWDGPCRRETPTNVCDVVGEIEWLFNDKTDDLAREYAVNSCDLIARDSTENLITLIKIMMDGPKGTTTNVLF